MEGKAAGCVLGREKVMIIAIIILLAIAATGYIICASVPNDPREDEEQERYLKEWKEKHGSGKKEHRTDTDGV